MKKTIRMAALAVCLCLMTALFCSCSSDDRSSKKGSSKKIPKGIYVIHYPEPWHTLDDDGFRTGSDEYMASFQVYCVHSDKKVSKHYVKNHYSDYSDGIFNSTKNVLSDLEQDIFYDDFKFKGGKLVNTGSDDTVDYCVKISDDPTEFDRMDEVEVFDEIMERLD